jgi:hypothetical protein
VATYEAKTALPYKHLQRATAGLRAELRDQLLAAGDGGLLDWSTLQVTGPERVVDERGHVWWTYEASVESRSSWGPVASPECGSIG